MMRPYVLAIMISTLLSPPVAFAHEDSVDPRTSPLWELGIGAGATYTPDYPGSAQNHLWAIPFPWGIYRGELLHSDRRGGTRARFIRSAGWEFNASAAGGLPSSSRHNLAREGMPDLELLGEAGPRLTVDLVSYPAGSLLRLGLPIRAAFSTNWRRLTDRGFTFAPELLYDDPNAFGSRFDAFVLFTTNFIDRRFANYFYGVEPAYAMPDRSPYTAKAGYLLSDLSFGVMVPIPSSQLRLYTYASLQSLSGASNEGSPLFKTPFNASVSAVLIWAFAESRVRVVPED